MLEDDDAGVPQLAGSKHSLEETDWQPPSPVAVGAVQLAHTFVVSEAAEATVTGGTPGPGVSSQAEQNQREQEAHRERLGGVCGLCKI